LATGVILGDADARAQLAHRGQCGRFDLSDIGLSHNCNVLRLAHYDHLMRQQCDLNKLLHDDIRHLSRSAVDCASLC